MLMSYNWVLSLWEEYLSPSALLCSVSSRMSRDACHLTKLHLSPSFLLHLWSGRWWRGFWVARGQRQVSCRLFRQTSCRTFWMLSMLVFFGTLLSSASRSDEKHLEVLVLVSTNAVKFYRPGHSFQQEIGGKKESQLWHEDAILALAF